MPIAGVVIITDKKKTSHVLNKLNNIENVTTYGVNQDNNIVAVFEGDSPSQLEKMNVDCMLVGHLPHLERLASYLLCQDPGKKVVDFSMAGIVCLTRDESGTWSVSWMVIPEIVTQ